MQRSIGAGKRRQADTSGDRGAYASSNWSPSKTRLKPPPAHVDRQSLFQLYVAALSVALDLQATTKADPEKNGRRTNRATTLLEILRMEQTYQLMLPPVIRTLACVKPRAADENSRSTGKRRSDVRRGTLVTMRTVSGSGSAKAECRLDRLLYRTFQAQGKAEQKVKEEGEKGELTGSVFRKIRSMRSGPSSVPDHIANSLCSPLSFLHLIQTLKTSYFFFQMHWTTTLAVSRAQHCDGAFPRPSLRLSFQQRPTKGSKRPENTTQPIKLYSAVAKPV